MKIQEIVDEQLYKSLLNCNPTYRYGSIGAIEQTREYDKQLYDKIYDLITPFNPKLKPNFIHINKAKDRVELWKEQWIRVKKGKNIVLVRQDDWIEVYAKGGTIDKSKQVDPESAYRVMQEVVNNIREW